MWLKSIKTEDLDFLDLDENVWTADLLIYKVMMSWQQSRNSCANLKKKL